MANRGGPQNPLSEAELRRKFTINATRLLPTPAADRLAEAILRLDELGAPGEVIALARR